MEMFDNIFDILIHIKNPYLITLIGPPLSGKSTFISCYKGRCIGSRSPHFNVISRDETLLETYGSNDYGEAWSNVDQKLVDKNLMEKFEKYSNSDENVIIDMTNMTTKNRSKNNEKFPKHYKVAVVMSFDKDKLIERNVIRKEKENKFIPEHVIDSMIRVYEEPTLSEGFDLIIKF